MTLPIPGPGRPYVPKQFTPSGRYPSAKEIEQRMKAEARYYERFQLALNNLFGSEVCK